MKPLLITVLLAMAGCSTFQHQSPPPPAEVVQVPTYVKYDCGTAPALDLFHPILIHWEVKPDSDGSQLFTLTPEEYENLGRDMAGLLSSAKQLQAQRDFYVECIKRADEASK